MSKAPRVNVERIKKITAERNIDLRFTYAYILIYISWDSIVDRFTKNFWYLLNRYQTNHKSVSNYNTSYNSGIKGIPEEPENAKMKFFDLIKNKKANYMQPRFNVVVFKKSIFSNGSLHSWSSKQYILK